MKNVLLCCIVTVFVLPGLVRAQITVDRPMHAHNDYEHQKPLLEALEHRFSSIEADIHLVGDELLVGHDPEDLRPDRTLRALYLEPLRKRVRENNGAVYPDSPSTVILLIDVKTDAKTTYAALKPVLRSYASMLTLFTDDHIEPGAVTAIISGNRDRRRMEEEAIRFAAFDGRLEDLNEPLSSAAFIPLVSSSWAEIVGLFGRGPFTEKARAKMDSAIRKAHEQGRLIRFWATPDTPEMWQTLLEAGVDMINTDDLDGLDNFLKERGH